MHPGRTARKCVECLPPPWPQFLEEVPGRKGSSASSATAAANNILKMKQRFGGPLGGMVGPSGRPGAWDALSMFYKGHREIGHYLPTRIVGKKTSPGPLLAPIL